MVFSSIVDLLPFKIPSRNCNRDALMDGDALTCMICKVPHISTPKKIPNTSTFDSQGCILLDHEGSCLTTNENLENGEPSREVTTVPSISVVTVNTPTDSFTENAHVSSTPLETAQVTLVTAVTDEKEPPPSTVMSVTPNEEICEQFDVAEPVDYSTQSAPPTPEALSGKFVGNVDHVVNNSNSSPSFVPFAHNNLFAVLDSADANDPSSVPPAIELVISNSPIPFTFASHDTSPAPQDPFVDDESTCTKVTRRQTIKAISKA
ncbi:hypothetical protein Bca4012_035429 [Brassica carinata]